jgi:hypothetical protein
MIALFTKVSGEPGAAQSRSSPLTSRNYEDRVAASGSNTVRRRERR